MQSGNPAASGGLVALELEPAEVELVLLPVLLVLGLVLLPLLVLGVSFRTCFVTLSQHFTLLEDVALDGGIVVVGVCATARPKLPVSIGLQSIQFRLYACGILPWSDWDGECSP